MAKNFYSAEEAAQKLGKSEDELKKLVQDGNLREFRDAGSVNYKVSDVDSLAGDSGEGAAEPDITDFSVDDIVLEPVDDSSIELAPSGTDILSLEDLDMDDTSAGTQGGTIGTIAAGTSAGTAAGGSSAGSSAIPSVGISVFDDDELDEQVDPLAQTAVSDIAGLGLEGTGSGSGILDLTRESDDTSLGAELLDEIYTEESDVSAGSDMQSDFDEALPESVTPEEDEATFETTEEPAAATERVVMVETVSYAPDAMTSGLTALLVVAIIVMWFAGLGSFSAVRGVTPSLLMWIYNNLAMCAGGAVLLGAIASAITFFMAKRGS